MRALALASICMLISACGGESKTQAPNGWVEGEYLPSRNFANICRNPRQNIDYPDLAGTSVDENNWIRSWSHETYLWYNELPDIDPATPSLADPIKYFDEMKTSAKTSSGLPKDRFHFTLNTQEYNQYTETGVSAGYGFTYLLIQSSPPRKAVIVYSESNSPAANNNIRRGAEIISIDGEPFIYGNADILNAGLIPKKLGEYHTFEIKEPNSLSTRTVVLQSTEITESPVYKLDIFSQNNQKIGYLALNTFGIAIAEKQLIDAVDQLKNDQINDLVLDLRYNSGGYGLFAATLGTMIAGNDAIGEIFNQDKFNDKHPTYNPVTGKLIKSDLFPSVTSGIFSTEKTTIPTLNLSRIFILSTENTASASEFLINALRGIDFEVILIGEKTLGKPYGFYATDNCGITYFSIQFKGSNAKGYGDYTDGFKPSAVDNNSDHVKGCEVFDDLSHPLGDKNERMLATALHYIENNECPVSAHNSNSKPAHPLSRMRGQIIGRYPGTGLLLQ